MELDELDFLKSDLDDITLSQICEVIENEECALEGINDMSIGDFDFGFLFGEQEEVLKTELPQETPKTSASPETKLSASPEIDEPQGRFARPITDKEIKLLTEDQECKNTKSNTRWAFGVWRKWREERNKLSSGEFIPEFSAMDASCMDYWLQRFVVEVRNQKGNEYTPKSLYYLMCGLLRHLRDSEIFGMNFLDHNDDRFARTRKVLDARMKSLVAQGIGTTVRQADPILPEQEDILWEKGVLGQNSAISLQNTVFFYACKVFGLRGCDEHRQLMCEQFKLGSDAQGKFIQFVGRQNKTYQGGLRQMQLSNKNIKHYCQPGDRSLYGIFESYLTTLGNDGLFYRKPLPGPEIRFGTQPLGINKLKSMMKEMCAAGGLKGNFTNHSGKRTCATQMYLSGIDEQEIMARTGHRSEKAVRKYKRSSDKIIETVSSVLDPPAPKKIKVEPPTAATASGEEPMEFDVKSCNSSTSRSTRNPGNRSVLSEITEKALFQNCQISFNFN